MTEGRSWEKKESQSGSRMMIFFRPCLFWLLRGPSLIVYSYWCYRCCRPTTMSEKAPVLRTCKRWVMPDGLMLYSHPTWIGILSLSSSLCMIHASNDFSFMGCNASGYVCVGGWCSSHVVGDSLRPLSPPTIFLANSHRCHQQYDPEKNTPASCLYHPESFTGKHARPCWSSHHGSIHLRKDMLCYHSLLVVCLLLVLQGRQHKDGQPLGRIME